jgi:ferredoxin
MKPIAKVDEFSCSAHGDCAAVAPGVFRVDDVAVVIGDGDLDLLVEAAEACPASAISVVDADTGEQLFPDGPERGGHAEADVR